MDFDCLYFKASDESAEKKKPNGFSNEFYEVGRSKNAHTFSPFCFAEPPSETITLMVSSIDRNFLLSPISMALLMSGTASLTASSMGTGGMFSPPAVMISSEKTHTHTHRAKI